MGLGRHELDRDQDSGEGRLSARQDVGVWWAGAEPDVCRRASAKGYNGAALQHSPAQTSRCTQDIMKKVYDKGKGTGEDPKSVGTVLYNRGMINAMMRVEAIRTAQAKYGKKPMTGEQVRWGIENLEPRPRRGSRQLGFGGTDAAAEDSAAPTMKARAWRASSNGTARKWVYVVRLDRGRQRDGAADGRGGGRQVRQGEEHHAARLLEGVS